jgi:hypothetical protein
MATTTASAIATLARAIGAVESAVRAADRPAIEAAVVELETATTLLPATATLSAEEAIEARVLSRRARSLFSAIEQASAADAVLLRALHDLATARAGTDLGPTAVDLRG